MGRPASGKWRAEPRSEPDSGHPTVRDRRGALGDVTHGEPRNPTRKSKERLWSLLAYRCARPGSIPTTRTSGSVGGQGQQRPWSTRPRHDSGSAIRDPRKRLDLDRGSGHRNGAKRSGRTVSGKRRWARRQWVLPTLAARAVTSRPRSIVMLPARTGRREARAPRCRLRNDEIALGIEPHLAVNGPFVLIGGDRTEAAPKD